MSGLPSGTESLTPREKRELLARLLRRREKGDGAGEFDHGAAAGRPLGEFDHGAAAGRPLGEVGGASGSHDSIAIEPEELVVGTDYGRFVNPYLGHLLTALNMDKEFVAGEGCFLYDAAGERYLDFIAQYGAVPFGFNPPEIWDALERARQNRRPSFVQPSILSSAGRLAKRLVEISPEGLSYVTFANSGAEAVEIAVKLCRSATGRKGVLSTRNSFHGKTLGAVSVTGNAFYQTPFGAPAPDFHHIAFGDLDGLERALSSLPDYYAAFIVEPIQGEGGIVEPPRGYLARAKDLCERHGVALVVDEVQTGLGRTGSLFACEAEGVTPDVMTLAKALGGGLLPIGACLSTAALFNRDFALRHSSTFAGNGLACEVGLATLDRLERDDGELLRQVARNGALLKAELSRLAEAHPGVLREVRGRGYLLGLRLEQGELSARESLIGLAARQNLLTYLVASYLLNVARIRVAPTASAGDVLRIEPPLVADESHCRSFLEAAADVIDVLENDDGARLLGHLVGAAPSPSQKAKPRREHRRVETLAAGSSPVVPERRFAFLVHFADGAGLVESFDPGAGAFTEEQIDALVTRMSPLCDPFISGTVSVRSRTGASAAGEVVVVPYTPKHLIELAPRVAAEKVARATELGLSRGAQIVGLGGFNAIATQGGLALRERGYEPLTTGNSYTVAASLRALRMASLKNDVDLASATVAIVGATGSLGRALTLLLAEEVPKLILLGNPKHEDWALDRMRSLVGELFAREVDRESAPGSLAARVGAARGRFESAPRELVHSLEEEGRLVLSTKAATVLHDADVVVTATSAVDTFIAGSDLKRGAIVCELSRPFNVTPEARRSRPDVLFLDGGLVHLPEGSEIAVDLALPPGVVFGCLAETMLLALEGFRQSVSLGWELDLPMIRYLDALGDKHGFVPSGVD